MDNQIGTRLPNPNPVTARKHRQEMWWQIILPIVVVAIIIIVLAVLSTGGTSQQVTQWSETATIFMVLPLLLILLITLAVFILLIYALTRLLRVLPLYSHQALIFLNRLQVIIRSWGDRAASPVITPSSTWAGLRAGLRRLRF